MDRITKSYLDAFTAEYELGSLPEDQAFERFAGTLVCTVHHSETIEPEDISVGGGADCGVDSIAVIVNGNLVTQPEEIEDLDKLNGYLDVTFIFTQAERTPGFSSSKIGQFAFGVMDFFKPTPQLPQNERVALYSQISQEIYGRAKSFRKGNPVCALYYVTTGKWTSDANIDTRRQAAQKDLESLSIFRKVTFECIDAERLQKLYQASTNAIKTEIVFSQKMVVPEMKGVEQAYLGLLPVREFLKLVENENSEMQTPLFYDNVRHWQDWNPVNSEMRTTLNDESSRVYFPLMNNGVTVVAKRLSATGNKFVLEDYQIVNGCQTSYVLHEVQASTPLDDSVLVPVRLVATEDESIRNAMIRATNRQTQVTEDQMLAVLEFPKKLETFFSTFKGKHALYYERRSRQYSGMHDIEKVRIVGIATLVRAYASVFLEIPHRTTRNYRALLDSVGKLIFRENDRLAPYYAAAFAHYRLEFLFRSGALDSKLKPARYHILMAFRNLAETNPPPAMSSKDMEDYCKNLMATLWDDDKSKSLFLEAAELVKSVADEDLTRDNIRTEPFTRKLQTALKEKRDSDH